MKTNNRSRPTSPSPATLSDLRAASIEKRLHAEADPELARFQQGFFRTEPGGYGEGDRFLNSP